MSLIKPTKPELFDCRRDALVVGRWLYQVEIYLSLLQAGNHAKPILDKTKIAFASSVMKNSAANWWYMLVRSGNAPGEWEQFKNGVKNEFVPQECVQRARDKLRNLRQLGSVSSYLNHFRNIIIETPGITSDEQLDKFCSGLKSPLRIEVLKESPSNMNEASRIALNIDSVIYGSRYFNNHGSNNNSSGLNHGYDAMEMGILSSKTRDKIKNSSWMSSQRKKDMDNNACFNCHEV